VLARPVRVYERRATSSCSIMQLLGASIGAGRSRPAVPLSQLSHRGCAQQRWRRRFVNGRFEGPLSKPTQGECVSGDGVQMVLRRGCAVGNAPESVIVTLVGASLPRFDRGRVAPS
jgi:hypothetical protein